MHLSTALLLLVPYFVASIVFADMPRDDAPRKLWQMRSRRSMYVAMMDGIGLTKEATRKACMLMRHNFCKKFATTLAIERTRRDTNTEMNTKKDTNENAAMDTMKNAKMAMNTKTDTNPEAMNTKKDMTANAAMNTMKNANMEMNTKTEKNAEAMDTKKDMAANSAMNTMTNANAEAMGAKKDTTNAEMMNTRKDTEQDSRKDANAEMGARKDDTADIDGKRGSTNTGAAAVVASEAGPASTAWMMDAIVPGDVNTLVDRTTKELRKTTEQEGFYAMSQADQERAMLEAAAKQGEIVKSKLKEAIEEARKMVERAIGTVISYSETPMESKIAMEQVYLTLTDETKTPKQKVDRIKEIQQKWTPEMRAALNPTTDDKEINEVVQFFNNLPGQIELGKN